MGRCIDTAQGELYQYSSLKVDWYGSVSYDDQERGGQDIHCNFGIVPQKEEHIVNYYVWFSWRCPLYYWRDITIDWKEKVVEKGFTYADSCLLGVCDPTPSKNIPHGFVAIPGLPESIDSVLVSHCPCQHKNICYIYLFYARSHQSLTSLKWSLILWWHKAASISSIALLIKITHVQFMTYFYLSIVDQYLR